MCLTYREIETLIDELRGTLEGGWIQKVYSKAGRSKSEWVLQIRGPGETLHLLLSTDPDFGRLHLVNAKPEQPDTPDAFTMLLRKWLPGHIISSVRLLEDDRIVEFRLTREGEDAQMLLHLELTGRHAILVLTRDGTVLGANRVTERARTGATYTVPPAPKLDRETSHDIDIETELSAGVERWAETGLATRDFEAAWQSLNSGLRASRKRLRRLRANIEKDLESAEAAETHKIYGELLQGAYGKLEAGAAFADVTNYYAEGMPTLRIELDPSRSLQANIDRHFHQYRRLKDARDTIETRLLEVMEELNDVEEAIDELEELSDIGAVEALKERVEARGILRKRQRASRRRGKEERAPFHEFRAKSGAAILVGRGAKDNDVLSLKIARGRDFWLHARDWPGSHVILRMDKNDQLKSEDLLDAATLAAHYSKGARDTLVDVTYTRAKHIRKPKGAAPGMVTVADANTIAIGQDPERLARLFSNRQ